MKMTTRFMGMAVIICLLSGINMVIYAQPLGPVPPDRILNPPVLSLPELNFPEISRNLNDLSAYEQFGLTYNDEKGGYFYENKPVGLLADRQGRGLIYLSQNGEIHVKAIRNSGQLTGLTELSAEEYNAIAAEMDAIRSSLNAKIEQLAVERELFRARMLNMQKDFSMPMRPVPPQHMREIDELNNIGN